MTISSPDGLKVYNSANKLFMLSKRFPVGVMIFGNAELLGVPWEVIIKSYRESLADSCFVSLEGYVDNFVSFLTNNMAKFFPSEAQQEYIQAATALECKSLAEKVNADIVEILEAGDQVDETRSRNLVFDEVSNRLQKVQAHPFISSVDEGFVEQILHVYGQLCKGVVEQWFKPEFIGESTMANFQRLVMNSISREPMNDSCSGIVFAGYGMEEIFPSLKCLMFDGVVCDRLIYKSDSSKEHCVSLSNRAVVVPFGQDDMACLFMEGIDRNYHEFLLGTLMQVFDRLPEMVSTALQDSGCDIGKLRGNLGNIMRGVSEEITSRSISYMRENHVSPIVNTVGMMSKDEMAVMAETLVNLTAFKRRITLVTETVGGPIDVAVISRGDGFVWIKRKHYFDPNLNHHFFSNYYK